MTHLHFSYLFRDFSGVTRWFVRMSEESSSKENRGKERRAELPWKLVKQFHPRVRKASKPAGNFRLMRYLYRIVSRSKIRYLYQPFRTFIRISRGRNRNAAVKIFNLSRNWTVQRLYPSRKLATPSRIGGPIWPSPLTTRRLRILRIISAIWLRPSWFPTYYVRHTLYPMNKISFRTALSQYFSFLL